MIDQFCWECLVPWPGYMHTEALFPAPGRMQFTCHSKAVWAKRVGMVTLVIPVGTVLVAGLAVPLGVAAIMLYPSGITRSVLKRL